MSPEQARGLRNIDHRSDLWSLGVIAHKCVTGVLPFEGESVGDLLVKICTAPVPTPSVTVPGLPASFDAWFFRALEREPSQRFARASELADALAFAAGLSTRGPTSSREPAPGTSTRAAIGPVSTSTAGSALPVAGVTSAPFTTASVSAVKPTRGVLFAIAVAALIAGSIGVATVVKLTSTPRADVPTGGASAMGANAATSASVPAPSSPPSSSPEAVVAVASTVPPVVTASARPLPAAALPASPRPKPVSQTTAPTARPATGKSSPNAADPGY
jgi:serine/threonine-protein kinase